MVTNDYGNSIEVQANCGSFEVNKDSGNYKFKLWEISAEEMPRGSAITPKIVFNYTRGDEELTRTVYLVIEGPAVK